jgi:hypothetical protein
LLLWAFNDLAEGGPTTDAARIAEFDPHSREFDAALSYLVDVGHLVGNGDARYMITLEGIDEMRRRPQLQTPLIPDTAPPVQARALRACSAAERPHSLPWANDPAVAGSHPFRRDPACPPHERTETL